MIGTVLNDRYRLDAEIGRGGIGVVYRGTDTQTGQPIAVKVLRPEIVAGNPDLVTRLIREGEALRQLNHPNIVQMAPPVRQLSTWRQNEDAAGSPMMLWAGATGVAHACGKVAPSPRYETAAGAALPIAVSVGLRLLLAAAARSGSSRADSTAVRIIAIRHFTRPSTPILDH